MGLKASLYKVFGILGLKNKYLVVLLLIKDRFGLKHKDHSNLVKFYKQFLPRDSVVFDIGANLGIRTIVFAELGKRVIAVEPNPELFFLLQKRFNSKQNVVLLNFGCAAESTLSKFYVANNHLVSSFSKKFISFKKSIGEDRNWFKEVHVQMITLDQIIKDYGVPHFCKIDVEGFELEVLSGLSQKIPIVAFEFTLPAFETELKDCIACLSGLGYTSFNMVLGESTKFIYHHWLSKESLFLELKSLFGKSTQQYGDIYAR